MNTKKILDKLEGNLAHFLIDETCKSDPTKRDSSELYKYKGLNISADPRSLSQEKTISVRIGVLEAEFKIGTGEKSSGCLAPEDERMVLLWLSKAEVKYQIKAIFAKSNEKLEIPIIPFDLEHFYEKANR